MIRFGNNEKKGPITAPAAAEPGSRSSTSEFADESLGERVSQLTPHERAVRDVEKFTSSMTDDVAGRSCVSNKCNLL